MGGHLSRENGQQTQGQPLEVVVLQQLIQVDAQQLENQAQVLPPGEAVQHAHDVVLVVGVHHLVQVLQHPHLHASLHSQDASPFPNQDAASLKPTMNCIDIFKRKQYGTCYNLCVVGGGGGARASRALIRASRK